jgi:hypothetical protein
MIGDERQQRAIHKLAKLKLFEIAELSVRYASEALAKVHLGG